MNKSFLLFETDRLIIRPLQESDKDYYMALRIETSDIRQAYETMPEFREYEWEKEFEGDGDASFCIFLKPDRIFVGSCSYQNFKSDTVELGIDLVKEHRNKGIGTEVVNGLVRKAGELFPGKSIILRTNANNVLCRRVAEKCGATLSKYEPSLTAQVMAKLLEITDEMDSESLAKNKEYIEENKEGLCVYTFGQTEPQSAGQ